MEIATAYKEPQKMEIALLLPSYNQMSLQHEQCMRPLYADKNLVFIEINSSIIDLSRNILAHNAINETKADIFMWIDSDMLFGARDVYSLCKKLAESDYDVLGAMCPKRASLAAVAGCPAEMGDYEFWNAEKADIIPAEYLGMAFTAVKRQTYINLQKYLSPINFPVIHAPAYPYYMPIVRTGVYAPEDVTFCHHVRDAGMKIGIDPVPKILHQGSYNYGIEDSGTAIQRVDAITLSFQKQ